MLQSRISSTTTYNASDMVSGITHLRDCLNRENASVVHTEEKIHIRCIVHIINLAGKETMKLLHGKVTRMRTLLTSLRSSVRRRDVFRSVCEEIRCRVDIPGFNVETRCSSTFSMLQTAYICMRVLEGLVERVPEMCDLHIFDD